MGRVLLVEDDAALADGVAMGLRKRMFRIDIVGRLDEAEAVLADEGPYEAVILDRRLPDGEGADLLPIIARLRPRPGVIFLTARDTLADKIEGLEAGGDDYLVKPFEIDELAARLKALFRRPDSDRGEARVWFHTLCLDRAALHILVGGAPMPLPRRELLALSMLIEAEGRAVRRDALLTHVYGHDADYSVEAIEGHLSRLRRRLATAGANVLISAVRGFGYRLERA